MSALRPLRHLTEDSSLPSLDRNVVREAVGRLLTVHEAGILQERGLLGDLLHAPLQAHVCLAVLEAALREDNCPVPGSVLGAAYSYAVGDAGWADAIVGAFKLGGIAAIQKMVCP